MIGEIRRRFALLTPGERLRWASMAPLGLACALLEAIGGALVFALLTLLVDPLGPSGPSAAYGRVAGFVRTYVGPPDSRSSLIALAACAALVHIAKNLLLVGFTWWRARVVSFDSAALAARLLRAYVAAPWPFHLRRGSAALMENLRESPRPFFDIFESAATILTEAAVVLALTAVAIAVAPLAITAIMAAIVLVVAITGRLTREAQRRGGARQFELGAALYRHVQHSLGALKEVRILGRGRFFADAFAADAQEIARLDTRRATLDAVPRVLLETAFVLGLLALIAFGSGAGSPASVLPLVSLYAYTGLRAIPAAHRIALQINSLRWGLAATTPLIEDLTTLESLGTKDHAGAPRLELRKQLRADGVSFTYEGASAPVLNDVSLVVHQGESVAIVGATGAGKTTFVDVLIGLLTPSSGRVTVDGTPIGDSLPGWHRNIGYVPQVPFLLDDTIRRNIALGVADAEIDEKALARAATAARLDGLLQHLPQGLDTVVGERGIRLSGGERQRVAIARALYRDPALIVFDEATSALDPGTERDVAQAIDALRGRRTVIVIAHRLTTVERCDRVLLLIDGRIEAAGAYTELAASHAGFRAIAALN